MINTLIIDFSQSNASVEWALYEGDVKISSGTDSLLECSELAKNRQLIVLVPSDNITFTQLSIPKGQLRHLEKVIPSLLEDTLASDIESLHFAHSSVSAVGDVNVAVIEKQLVAEWIATLEQANLKPAVLLPNIFAIPLIDKQWGLSIQNGVCALRTAPQMGHVFDYQNISMIYGALAGDDEPTVSIFNSDDLRDSRNVGFPVEQREPLDKLARLPCKSALEMNLLQGAFKPQSNLKRYWSEWKFVIILAMLSLGVHLTNVGVQTWQFNKQANNTKIEVEKLFRTIFPDENRIVNVKAQAMQRIQSLQSQQDNAGFLMLLQSIAPALKSVKNVTLSRISYEGQLAEMRLDIEAKEYSELEKLKITIDKEGFSTDLGSVSGDKDAYSARLVIRGQQ